MTSAGPRPVPLSPRRRGPAEPSTCDGCGEWFYERELTDGVCPECRGLDA